MQTEDRSTQPVNFIRFHGISILVVEHQGIAYIEVKPINDLCGLDWKSTKRTVQTEENARFYGTKALLPPEIGGEGGTGTPQTRLYFRLDKSRMFIARISTANVRSRGNAEAAEFIYALQEEWAKVLHDYETHGVAVKSGRSNALKDVHQLVRTRDLLQDPRERAVFTRLLHEELAAIGLPIDTFDDPQQSLALSEAK